MFFSKTNDLIIATHICLMYFQFQYIFSVLSLPLAKRVAPGDRDEWLTALVLEQPHSHQLNLSLPLNYLSPSAGTDYTCYLCRILRYGTHGNCSQGTRSQSKQQLLKVGQASAGGWGRLGGMNEYWK